MKQAVDRQARLSNRQTVTGLGKSTIDALAGQLYSYYMALEDLYDTNLTLGADAAPDLWRLRWILKAALKQGAQPVTPMAAHDIYAAQLAHLRHGCALWCPEPWAYGEVKVGDVGYLWRGAFFRLFNATLAADDPDNARFGVPDDFVRLELPLNSTYFNNKFYDPGDVLRSSSVKKFEVVASGTGTAVPAGAGFRFECSDRYGAVLMFRRRAIREDTIHRQEFEQYILTHFRSWYKFANDRHRRGVKPGQIMLVTGCDKTAEWASAVFSDRERCAEISFSGGLTSVASGELTVSGTWVKSNSVQHRTGPVSHDPVKYDQAVFIRGFKVRERPLLTPKVIEAAAEPQSPGPRDPEPESVHLHRENTAPANDDDDVIVESVPEDRALLYDRTSIPLMLFPRDKDVALVHDDDWCTETHFHPFNGIPPESTDRILQLYTQRFFDSQEQPVQQVPRTTCDSCSFILDRRRGRRGRSLSLPLSDSDCSSEPMRRSQSALPSADMASRHGALEKRCGCLHILDDGMASDPLVDVVVKSHSTDQIEQHARHDKRETPSLQIRVSQVSILCRFPPEILAKIALEVVLIDPIGLPSDLIALLCSCKWINDVLTFKNAPDLYARIHRGKFDIGAPRRRFGRKVMRTHNLAHQLCTYCAILKTLRTGDIYDTHVLWVFWGAFFMLTENDGKNRAQLEWAGVDEFVDRFVRVRLLEGRSANHGWPVESPINALALWLLWATSSEEKLVAESEQQRQQIVELVLPYVIAACRYPSAHLPQNHFQIPIPTKFDQVFLSSGQTVHGSYPLYREPDLISNEFTHYGINLKISPPLITTSANLIYSSRREIAIDILPHLPRDRAHAPQLRRAFIAPTQADIFEFNTYKHTKLVRQTRWDWWAELVGEQWQFEDEGLCHRNLKTASSQWDEDFMRWMYCWNPWVDRLVGCVTYSYGMLDGLWQGRMLVPDETMYMQLIATHDFPAGFSERQPFVATIPLYMRLREHHCISPEDPVLVGGKGDGFDDGLLNAWLPYIRMTERGGILRVEDPGGNVFRYETYYPGRENSHNDEMCTSGIRVDMRNLPSEFEGVFAEAGLGKEPSDNSDEDDEEFVKSSCQGIQDIILTGETDPRHGEAWGPCRFYGRIRAWDGLICLIRVPVRPDSYSLEGDYTSMAGRLVFTGYITGGQNFVGNWRAMHGDVGTPALEAAFTMSKRA